jgi:RND family efflux transporter MFP subunit
MICSSLTMSLTPTGALAQPPAGPVKYTVATKHDVHRRVSLPGNVEARTESPVTAEVAGFVVELIAHEGDAIKSGGPLARLRTRNLELQKQSTEGQLKEAQALLRRAERDLDRAKRLREQDLLPEEELDSTEATKMASEGRIQQIEANLERIELDIKRCTILAPFDGVVVREYIDVGAWIDTGSPVVEMVSMGALEVRVDVPQSYFQQVQIGAPVEVSLTSDRPIQIMGQVTAIIPRAEVRSRVFPIKVAINNEAKRLATGMLVQVSVPVGESRSVTLVPKDAVINQGASRIVYIINAESMAEALPIQTGEGYGAWIEANGIEPGTRVITRGNERIFPGQPVAGELQEYELP